MRSLLGVVLIGWISVSAASALSRAAEPSIPAANVEIDRIEVTGITAFPQSEIEEALEVSPGDRLERVKVVRTAENLQELYRNHGYEETSIRSRLTRKPDEQGTPESVLEFSVAEGRPTRIASIRFTPESIRDESFGKFWRSLEGELHAKAALLPGDVFDQEKVGAGKHAVQDLLASEEFVGAKVDDMKVTAADAPVGMPQDKLKSTARWVALDFHIDLGDRVAFGFRGNTVFTHGKLSSLVDEQRVLGFGKDYIGSIRQRIEEEYRSEGYADVKVTPYTSEKPARHERHVTYDLVEGPRVALERVDFDGNVVFSTDELREQYNQRASVLLQHGYYVERDVQKAADLVVEWMKSKGYLAAKVVTITTLPAVKPKRAGQKPSAVRIIIYFYEGDQTIVRSASFDGLHAFSAEEVKARLGLKEEYPLNLFAFSEGLESLKAAYRARGYLAIRIVNEGTDSVVKYSDESRSADIQLQISEGLQYHVSSIAIDGLVSTKEYVVRRELAFKEGDVLSETALTETEARLRRLGIFSVVTVHLHDDPKQPDAKRVEVSLQEGTPGVLAGGPGYRTDLGIRLFGQVAYTNLWGLNHTLSFTASANHRLPFANNGGVSQFHFVEYQAQLAYLYPWFMGQDILFRPSFTVSGIQYVKFDATTIDAAVTWEKRLFRDPGITGLFTYSLERVNQFNATQFPSDNQQIRLGSIIPALRLDTRDNPLSPTSGWFANFSYEFSAPWIFSQTSPFPIGYSRIQGRVDRLIPLGHGVSWYLSFRAGYERSSENPVIDPATGKEIGGEIPLIKQFALGGAGSVRGYTEQELNAYDESIRGSLSYVNYRTQIDLPLAGALRFGPFLDAANLLVDNHSVGQFLFDSLQLGAGFGFHYQTPVGPVNLDLGFKLSPPASTTHPGPGEGDTNFYFSIGLI